jgi:hypothetical protein
MTPTREAKGTVSLTDHGLNVVTVLLVEPSGAGD